MAPPRSTIPGWSVRRRVTQNVFDLKESVLLTLVFAVLVTNLAEAWMPFQPQEPSRLQNPALHFSTSRSVLSDHSKGDRCDHLQSANMPYAEYDGDEWVFDVGAQVSNATEVASDDASTTSLNVGALDLRSFSSNVSYFYLKDELGLSEEVMMKITYGSGSVLGLTTANIRNKVEVLRNLMDLSDDELRTIIARQPSVLQLSADKNISPTILNLLRLLDLGRDELKALIVSFPGILTYSQKNLRDKVHFFIQELGLSRGEARSLVLKEPTLFKTGVKTGLLPRMRFLLNEIRIHMEELRQIVMRHPRMLPYSVENNLAPKLVFYCLLTIRLEPPQVVKLLKRYPEFMGYNLDSHI